MTWDHIVTFFGEMVFLQIWCEITELGAATQQRAAALMAALPRPCRVTSSSGTQVHGIKSLGPTSAAAAAYQTQKVSDKHDPHVYTAS